MRNALPLTAISFSLALLGSASGQVVLATEADTGAAANVEETAPESSKVEIHFDDGSLSADVSGAPLSEVAKQLQEVTGVTVVLAGEQSGAKEPVWAKFKPQPLDKALAKLLKGFSYTSQRVEESEQLKITIYLEAGKENNEVKSAVTTSDSVGETLTQSDGVSLGQANDWATSEGSGGVIVDTEAGSDESESHIAAGSGQSMEHPGDTTEEMAESELDSEAEVANLPYDLDELFELPPQPVSENEDDYAKWGARTHESRLNRSMSAIDSQHSNIRRMAVDELVSTKDPRATSGIVYAATREGASAEERTLAAEALWRHAADLEFNSPSAVQSLQQLSTDSNSDVADMAKRALADMERYQRRRR